MKKKSSIQCLISVMFIGMITKIISMSSRILSSRELGVSAVSIYSLVNPIFVFLITIASFSLPTAIATLISKHPEKGKKVFLTCLMITMAINLVIIALLLAGAEWIARSLLHNADTIPSLYLLCIVVPLTSVSSLVKGYYLGRQEMILTSTSSLIEECSRLLSVICLGGLFVHFSDSVKATFFVLVMIIGEIIQTTYLIFTSGSYYIRNIAKLTGFFEKENYIFPEVMQIGLPLTLSRLVTSFTFMLEPILITSLLTGQGMDGSQVTLEYGILSSYVTPMLMFPGFFSLAISNYLLPKLSSLIGKKRYAAGEKLFNRILLYTFLIGSAMSVIFFFFGGDLIRWIYRVDYGKEEIRRLAIPFVIYYIETPINISMHALNLSRHSFRSSLASSLLRLILLVVLSRYLSVFAVSAATLASCYLDVLLNYLMIHRVFKRNDEKAAQ